MHPRIHPAIPIFVALAVCLPCPAADEAKPEPSTGASPVQIAGIENAFRVSDRIFSGSQPEGDASFEALKKLGVKTIISVDGSRPDIETARKHGLRYVHLPIGYDGISPERAVQLSKAATTVEGPIFVHCHHGKHRGPAAVAIFCETAEKWSSERAEAWLKEAGTATDYPGLYRSVREFKVPSKEQLNRLGPLPELTKPNDLVDTMLEIDERFDALKAVQKAGWKIPQAHPDLVPANEATLLWEHFREMGRFDDTAKRPEDYRTKLAEAERAADVLQTGLKAAPLDAIALDAAFKQTTQNCAACHKAFRNEKK